MSNDNIIDSERQPRVAWHKMSNVYINENYTVPLDEEIDQLLQTWGIDVNDIVNDQNACLNHNAETVNSRMGHLIDAMNRQSNSLKHFKVNKALKPYWNKHLTQMSKVQKQTRRDWILAGKPRDTNNPEFIKYKEAKKDFRRERRRKIIEYENQCMKDLADSQELDQRQFWHFVKKNKNGKKRLKSNIFDTLQLFNTLNKNEFLNF